MFELYRRYTLSLVIGSISLSGIDLIMRHINAQYLQNEPWKALNQDTTRHYIPALPENWQWVWLINKGDYRGTFPKRVAQYYHKAFGINCPPEFLSEIGNLARLHSNEQLAYEFDFADRIDWRAGEFGEEPSSCIVNNPAAIEAMESGGCLAIRFYNTEGKGYARAWIAPVDDYYIVFNGYGFPGNATVAIARIFAEFVDGQYRRISLTNYGNGGGDVYINGETGYAVGKDVAHVYSHDLEWGEGYSDYCESCGQGLTEYDVYFGANDYTYCESCYDERFDRCESCYEVCWRENIVEVNDRWLCPSCAEDAQAPEPESE